MKVFVFQFLYHDDQDPIVVKSDNSDKAWKAAVASKQARDYNLPENIDEWWALEDKGQLICSEVEVIHVG